MNNTLVLKLVLFSCCRRSSRHEAWSHDVEGQRRTTRSSDCFFSNCCRYCYQNQNHNQNHHIFKAHPGKRWLFMCSRQCRGYNTLYHTHHIHTHTHIQTPALSPPLCTHTQHTQLFLYLLSEHRDTGLLNVWRQGVIYLGGSISKPPPPGLGPDPWYDKEIILSGRSMSHTLHGMAVARKVIWLSLGHDHF